jgi:hypothetical protein
MSVRGRSEAWRWVKARVGWAEVVDEMELSVALVSAFAGSDRRKTMMRS